VELSTPSSVLAIQVTPEVSRALLLAQEAATKAQRPRMQLEDVLLGLLQLEEGKVAKVFEHFGMDSAKVQALLQRLQNDEPQQDAPAT
jgi:ATP-dependent Clp protease ATP-binding subunit ClpA